MEKEQNREQGLLSLEASIALTIFMFLMLFLYSFFVVFEARNEMAHVLLSTADSLSLDTYGNSALGESGTIGQVFYWLYGNSTNSQNDFTDHRIWYGSPETDDTFQEVIQSRFIAYLTGGNAAMAEEILGRYHVKGGVDGLDFSSSRIEGGDLYLSVKYTLEYEFHVFNGGEVEFEQSVCSKLWE